MATVTTSDDKVATQKVQTLNSCLLWAAGVLEVVAGIIGQCGSKCDAKRQGEREKGITTRKWRPVTKSGDSDDKVATLKVQTLHACLLWAAGVMEVVAGITGQCGSKSDAKWPRKSEKSEHHPKVAKVK